MIFSFEVDVDFAVAILTLMPQKIMMVVKIAFINQKRHSYNL